MRFQGKVIVRGNWPVFLYEWGGVDVRGELYILRVQMCWSVEELGLTKLTKALFRITSNFD